MRGILIGILAGIIMSSWNELLAVAGTAGLLRGVWCYLRGYERNAESAARLQEALEMQTSVNPRIYPVIDGLVIAVLCVMSGTITMWLNAA